MTEIFAQGTGSSVVSNGGVRIKLVQLRRQDSKAELSPQATGTLLLPVGSLKNLTMQLAKALEQLKERQAERITWTARRRRATNWTTLSPTSEAIRRGGPRRCGRRPRRASTLYKKLSKFIDAGKKPSLFPCRFV